MEPSSTEEKGYFGGKAKRIANNMPEDVLKLIQEEENESVFFINR